MSFPSSPWAWILIYLSIGLLSAMVMALSEVIGRRRARDRFEASREQYPWCRYEDPPQETPLNILLQLMLASVVWLPIIVLVVGQEVHRDWAEKRRKAWEASPEGQAQYESDYRERVEQEVAPWVPIEWITRRNVAWEEFAAEYEESKEWAQLTRDAFELLWSQVSEADEVACFSTPDETWQKNFGRAGWVVLRNGEVVGQLVTILN